MYEDPIIKKYIDLIKASVPEIKAYYQGDPIRIPKVNLPAVLISKAQTSVGPLTNAEDNHQIGIIITVITDIRDERSDDQLVAPGIAELYDIIEGREETTYKLKTKSILNILRTNQIVDAAYNLRTDLGSITRCDYGMTIGKRSPEGYATEGQVEFVATYSQLRT
jgi:hypothetical protein